MNETIVLLFKAIAIFISIIIIISLVVTVIVIGTKKQREKDAARKLELEKNA